MTTITGSNFTKIVGFPENYAIVTKGAQNDALLFDAAMVLIKSVYLDEAGAEAFKAASFLVASFTATDTTITYSQAGSTPRLKGDYILKVASELIHVKGDTDETAATGTLTVVRGAFKTTPEAQTEAKTAYLQNAIVLTSANVGGVKIVYNEIPLFRDGINMSPVEQISLSTTNPNRIYGSDYTNFS